MEWCFQPNAVWLKHCGIATLLAPVMSALVAPWVLAEP